MSETCRIESEGLKRTESKGAASRIAAAEEVLVEGQIRFARHVIARFGGKGSDLRISQDQREKIRYSIKERADGNLIE